MYLAGSSAGKHLLVLTAFAGLFAILFFAPAYSFAEETTITTGDADSHTEVDNEVNTNVVDTGNTPESGEGTEEEEAATEEESAEEESEQNTQSEEEQVDDGGENTVIIENENEAVVENEVETEAETGNNTASSTDNGVSIDTGDAYAGANVVNTVNTNIIDSNGLVVLLNRIFGGDVDLSGLFETVWDDVAPDEDFEQQPNNLYSDQSLCEDECGVADEYTVHSTSTASVSNDVVVRASTGDNDAESGSGDASIRTGNAYAGANVVNTVNTNIIGSNYLLLSVNNLGSLVGDIVLPGKSFFEELLASGAKTPASSSNVSVENNNDATVENTVSTESNTGNNTATSTEGGGSIDTGNAYAAGNVVNSVNGNYIGGTSLYFLVRVSGAWNGTVYSAPEGVTWDETTSGVQIYGSGGGLGSLLSDTAITNTNTATVTNNVSVVALTGENRAEGEDATVQTGNAYAGTNVVNVVNTNIIGENWILAMFNILGDWSGSVAFGRPDLWLGTSAATSGNTVGSDGEINYTFTVSNLGDADATDVVLDATLADTLIEFDDTTDPQVGEWFLGTIPAGETIEYTYSAHAISSIPSGSHEIPLNAYVSSHEPDADESNNSDTVSVVVQGPVQQNRGGAYVQYTRDSELVLTKVASVDSVVASSTVDYTLTIQNFGGEAYHAELTDTLFSDGGEVITEKTWWLGEIFPDEEITVTYSIEFASTTPPGFYTNRAKVYAFTRHPSIDPFYGTFGHSNIAESRVEVLPLPEQEGEVLGASTCAPYITTHIKPGANNDLHQVARLQTFLRYNGGFPTLPIHGEYDEETVRALREFQSRYTDEILAPWGHVEPTGHVYYTTQKHINEMHCEGLEEFPLTDEQMNEITSYRAR